MISDSAVDHSPSRHSGVFQAGIQKVRNAWMPASAGMTFSSLNNCNHERGHQEPSDDLWRFVSKLRNQNGGPTRNCEENKRYLEY